MSLARSKSSDPESFLTIGQILKPHGVHGEVRVRPLTDLPERFSWLDAVYLGEKTPQLTKIAGVRFHKDLILMKFEGMTNRDQVEGLRGKLVQVLESDAIPLEEGEYFLYELEGLDVLTDEGETLGVITRVIETGANNVFVVKSDSKEILLPDIDDVVLEIDFENGRMLVHLLPGLI
ncbi:MAG: ribosome maturation factor RimM [Chloroflexota bacterium]